MRCAVILVLVVLLGSCIAKRVTFVQQGEVQLSAPHVSVDSVFFRKETKLNFGAFQPGFSLCVTDEMDKSYGVVLISNEALSFAKSAKLNYLVKDHRYIPSEITKVQIYKVKDRNVDIEYLSPRTEPYNTAQATVLIDQQKAAKQFGHSGWLGFKQDSVVIELSLEAESIEGVALSFLQDQKSWIFGPTSMRFEAFDQDGLQLDQSVEHYKAGVQREGVSFQFLESTFNEIYPSTIRITIFPLASIPDWHLGAGKEPWLFIDEIVLL